jgi:hypothetical protein
VGEIPGATREYDPVFFLACLIWFYGQTGDRLFLVPFGIVGLGVVLTGLSFLPGRKGKMATDKRG